jgi:hypothetical protein
MRNNPTKERIGFSSTKDIAFFEYCSPKKKRKKKSFLKLIRKDFFKSGNDILSHTNAVPSALMGLTSLFGMGRGGPHCYSHQSVCSVCAEHIRLTYKRKKYKDNLITTKKNGLLNKKLTGN